MRAKRGNIAGIGDCPNNHGPFSAYLTQNKVPDSKRPRYLLPLDNWFAFIIYPSLAVKVRAEADTNVRDLIKVKKPTLSCADDPRSSAGFERYSKPFEIDLNACANF
jgi:hypothetical protein